MTGVLVVEPLVAFGSIWEENKLVDFFKRSSKKPTSPVPDDRPYWEQRGFASRQEYDQDLAQSMVDGLNRHTKDLPDPPAKK